MLKKILFPPPKKHLQKSLTRLVLVQFIDYWPYYLGAFISLYFTHSIQSYLPFLAKGLADALSQNLFHEVSTLDFFLAAIGIIIFRTSSRLLFFYPARLLQKDMRVEMLEMLEEGRPDRYEKHSAGQLFQILANDLDQIRALIGFALLQVGNIIIALAVLIPKIVGFHVSLLWAMIPMLASFIFFSAAMARNKKYYKLSMDLQGDVQNFLMESYSGKKTIKNFHAENGFLKLFKEYSFKELLSFYKAGVTVSFSIPLVPLGVNLSLIWGAYLIFVHDMGASSLIFFTGFVFLFLEPLMFLSWIGAVFASSIASWERIKKLVNDLNTETEAERFLNEVNKNENETEILVKLWDKDIAIKNYPDYWSVFIGETGVGKSTVLKQIADSWCLKGKVVSFVAQEPYLYNDTILANIFLGNEVSDERKQEAYELLKLFGLDYLASNEKDLFSLEVGEKGKRLSGGQAKRLALVRSLMSQASIIIWDDPFSSVDVILERQIIQRIRPILKEKKVAMILTTHRFSTAKMCDHIIYLDKEMGIREEGSTSELLTKDKKTYEYFQNQMV